MKGSHLLFVLTVSWLIKPSNGDFSFMVQQRHSLFRGVVDRCIDSHYSLSKYRQGLREPRQRRELHLLRFRGKKRASFLSPTRSASISNFARNIVQSSLEKIKSNFLTFMHRGVTYSKSLLVMTIKRFEWFQFPNVSRETIKLVAIILRNSLVGLIGFELVLILRDLFQEIFNDLQDFNYDEDVICGSSRKAISKNSVEKLIAWLEKPSEKRIAPSSFISPAWVITLAQELYECTELPLAEVQKILLQLTIAEVKLLQSCLLLSSNKIDFEEIGGLFRAKVTIAQLLLLNSKMKSPSYIRKSSPYEEMISKGNGSHNMALWGPPGSGKSLMIRAIATHLGLPTIVVSPILIQNRSGLETLFSLISTLGSCVVVLDDLDGLFPNRGNGDCGITTDIKTELLQWWDGVASYSKKCVFMVAATSRPWDVDAAAWRRLPNRIYIGLPNSEDRYDTLKKISKDLPLIEESVLQYFVSVTEGFIPLDLYQVLVHACQNGPMARQDTTLTIDDIHMALSIVSPTRFSIQYIQQLQSYIFSNNSGYESSSTQSQTQQPSSHFGVQDYFSPHIIESFPFCENGYCWETALGNFYQFQIPVDSEVMAAIQTILLYSSEWSSSDDRNFNDDNGDDDKS